MTNALVIGIGNPDCGDDAVGPLVARLLAGQVPPSVTIQARTGDMLGLIEDWAGRDWVVLVDAAALATAPGTIHRIDLLHDALPAGLALSSTHALGVADAVALARVLGQLPARLIVYVIEGERFEPGAPITPAVASTAQVVAARVADELTEDALHA